MKKLVVSILLCVALMCVGACSKEQPNIEPEVKVQPVVEEPVIKEVVPELETVTENVTYIIEEKQSLNQDYHIKNEATEITHLESLFDMLNEIS